MRQVRESGRTWLDVEAERAWLDALPKLELHVHFEGAIPGAALRELREKYGDRGDAPPETGRYRGFQDFLRTWMWRNSFLRELDDFVFAAQQVAAERARQSILYSEMFFSPFDFIDRGHSPQQLADAIRAGFERHPEVEIQLVADLVRDAGPSMADRLLSGIAEVKGRGVIGIGMGGREGSYPAQAFAAVYERARQLGLRTSAHAGETAGPQSIREALDVLRVDRIGHGIRVVEDVELLARVCAHRVPLEVCPTSNVRLGVAESLSAHPIRRLVEAGALTSVNTDDPGMFNTTLADEYLRLRQHLGFSRAGVLQQLDNALRSSWLDDTDKRAWRARLGAPRHDAVP